MINNESRHKFIHIQIYMYRIYELYGNIAAVCRGKWKCVTCRWEHKIQEYTEGAQEKCCNTGHGG